MGPVVTGVLAHEAFGHSQEADTCARGRSKAWELHKSGEVVGNRHATILNNPAIFKTPPMPFAAWGSYFFDEEGWLAQEQVLLDQGKLLEPMTNLTSAIRLGVPRTANGKRESWANGVYTRQTNTYFSAGDKTFDELMREMGDGFLAASSGGRDGGPQGDGNPGRDLLSRRSQRRQTNGQSLQRAGRRRHPDDRLHSRRPQLDRRQIQGRGRNRAPDGRASPPTTRAAAASTTRSSCSPAAAGRTSSSTRSFWDKADGEI